MQLKNEKSYASNSESRLIEIVFLRDSEEGKRF